MKDSRLTFLKTIVFSGHYNNCEELYATRGWSIYISTYNYDPNIKRIFILYLSAKILDSVLSGELLAEEAPQKSFVVLSRWTPKTKFHKFYGSHSIPKLPQDIKTQLILLGAYDE